MAACWELEKITCHFEYVKLCNEGQVKKQNVYIYIKKI